MFYDISKDDGIIQIISSHLQNKELALFCGAGISVPSGIPAVGGYDEKNNRIIYGIVTKILEVVGNNEDEVKAFFRAKLPFEALVEFLIQNGLDLVEIKGIFEGEPCYYHKAIVQLIEKNKLYKICTTNFDQCFEKALSEADLNSYPVFYKVQDFQSILRNLPEKFLVKVHGCISDPKNMAITIKEIGETASCWPYLSKY